MDYAQPQRQPAVRAPRQVHRGYEGRRVQIYNLQSVGGGFAWLDTGTHDSLSEVSTFIEVVEKRQGLKIACLEAIPYRKGWISEERMRELAQPIIKNQYGQYLLKVIDELKCEVNSTNILGKTGK